MKIKHIIIKIAILTAILRLVILPLAMPLTAQAADMAYADGVLLKGAGPEVYLISNGLKRWIASEQAFNDLDLNWQKIIVVSGETLKNYPTGQDIKNGGSYPDGLLLKGSGPKVFLITGNKRHWIPDESTFVALGLNWQNIQTINDRRLEKIYWNGDLASLSQTVYRPETILSETPAKTSEDNNVRFEFKVANLWDASDITFETFLTGKDNKWVATNRQYRDIYLPKENQNYTFYVRAKNHDGYVDLEAASYDFSVRLSPYYGQVTISGSPKNSNYQNEKVELYNKSQKPINITGWTLTNEKSGATFTVPQAYFIPKYTDLAFNVNLELGSGDKVTIFTQASPLGFGRDIKTQYGFQLNQCSGYLNNTYDFSPKLSNQCPKIELTPQEEKTLDRACQDTIKKLSACQPLTGKVIDGHSRSCVEFLKEKMSYESCVNTHRSDAKFLKGQWYVYIGAANNYWRDHDDALILRDERGLVVDRYEY